MADSKNIFQPTKSQLRKFSHRRPKQCKNKSCRCSCYYFDNCEQGFCFGINFDNGFDCVTLCQCFPATINDSGKLQWSEQNMHPAEAIWVAGALSLVAQTAIQTIPKYRNAQNAHVRKRHNLIRKFNNSRSK